MFQSTPSTAYRRWLDAVHPDVRVSNASAVTVPFLSKLPVTAYYAERDAGMPLSTALSGCGLRKTL
jgi:hypothetical protein